MEELLKRHIQETDKNFEDIHEELLLVKEKLEDLNDFKVRLLVSSRFFAFVVSAVTGIMTFIASTVITYYVNIKLNK